MNIGASLYHLNTNARTFTASMTTRTNHGGGDIYFDALLSKASAGKGGQIIMDNNARTKLDALAKEYLKEYPGLMRTYNEAWFYATFEVRGLAKRVSNGIMMLGPNSLSFKSADGQNDWTIIFDQEYWDQIKELFDQTENGQIEKKDFWAKYNI